MKLNSLNIRKGLELEVPVSDIFKVDTNAFGDKKAMEACEIGWREFIKKNDPKEILGNENGLLYSTSKIKHVISDSLEAYVYDSYMIYSDPEENGKIVTDKATEIEFLNTKILNLNDFFRNVMDAQSFSGLHKRPMFKYSFIGTGNFSMEDYIESHPLASHSTLHFLDFFIFHKKIFSSIGFFIAGLCENDIKMQKEYLTDKEYKEIMAETKRQRKAVKEVLDNAEDIGDNTYLP